MKSFVKGFLVLAVALLFVFAVACKKQQVETPAPAAETTVVADSAAVADTTAPAAPAAEEAH